MTKITDYMKVCTTSGPDAVYQEFNSHSQMHPDLDATKIRNSADEYVEQ